MKKDGNKTMIRIIGGLTVLAGFYSIFAKQGGFEWLAAFLLGGAILSSSYWKKDN